VIGVLAVIALVIVGAMWLAQSTGLTQASAEPTIEVVIQDPAATENGVIAGGPQFPASPTPTAEPPTATPAPSPTPIPPLEYTVQSGDTCGGIAQRFGVRLGELAALNNLDTERCLIRAGDKLLIPVPSPTPPPTATLPPDVTPPPTAAPLPGEPTATLPAQIVYVVKGGDTCSEIAQKFNVTVELLMQQNNLDANCLIRMNQVLTITFATPTPTVIPTPFVLQTPTPRAGYSAPIVMLPPDGAQISGTQEIVTLQWLTVGLLQENEWYVVQVQPSGAITVPIFETKATSLKLTQDILGDQEEREIVWWVQVKRFMGVEPGTGQRMYAEISPPSAARAFVWRKRPAGTPTPSP
jgi:LysM repeat protein